MKYLLAYSGNNGILYVSKNPTYANALGQGFPDAVVHTLWPSNPIYQKINQRVVFDNSKSYIFDRNTWDMVKVNPALDGDNFKQTKYQAKIRAKPIEWLMGKIYSYTVKQIIYPHDGFEMNMVYALSRCNPSNNQWSPEISEYARIVGLEPEHAYKEIALQAESNHLVKMRVYAWQRYFLDKMSTVYTQEQADAVYNEMQLRFVKDIRI